MSELNSIDRSSNSSTAENHSVGEVLLPSSRIIMQYARHVNERGALIALKNILDGNFFQTGWELRTMSGRAVDTDYPKELGKAELFTMDGALPLEEAQSAFKKALKELQSSDNEAWKLLFEFMLEKGIPSEEMDQLLEAIEVHWTRLPFNPLFTKKNEFLLLRGDSYALPGIDCSHTDTDTDMLRTKGDNEDKNPYKQEKKHQEQAQEAFLAFATAGVVSSILNMIDTQKHPQNPTKF